MKLPLVLTRRTATSRDLRAGCFVCHGVRARWTSANAQALAAQHHDRTGHPTWCDIALSVRYGRAAPDDRQHDIEDAIAASASSGDAPDCAPLPDLDASAAVTAGVSIPVGRPVETRRVRARAARGRKPEALHA
ncbi:hypothetical protein [Sphingomonas sp. Leaf37]|uniref:hypothetical protein n=1 Tax=Sphingomonas sp. Leaf37 TaxID=2876552 RepID=UPI001E3975B2|nr:hypothetical protein [Sphingomonas sp. Leaf37]